MHIRAAALALALGAACSCAEEVGRVDEVLVEKAKRRLTLLQKGRTVRQYEIALGFEPSGPKRASGDGRTPEGRYVIDRRNPNSAFHLSLHVSYPNEQDRELSAVAGVDPGGDIMIHGLKNGLGWLGRLHSLSDWTLGCIAVTNSEIEEIWSMVPDGTPIEIRP